MEIIQWGILLGLVLIVPFLLGMVPVTYMNKVQRTPAMTYVCGWFVSFSMFELVAVPFILLEQSFSKVVVVYSMLVMVLAVFSLWKGKMLFVEYWEQRKRWTELTIGIKLLWLLFFVLVAAQLLSAIFLEYYDGDDAYYVAAAVVTDTFDTMYLRDNYTGYNYELDIRHALSPMPVYQAWMSRVSGIHSTIIAHSVLSVVWLVLMYMIYAQIANRLFWKEKQYKPLFLCLISVWFCYGNISLYTAETFIMTRTWQGKGVMAGIVLPALFLCMLYLLDKKVNKGTWMLLVAIIISAVLATSVSFMLIPTVVGLSAVLFSMKKRSLKLFFEMCACCIPCLVLAVCYLLAA